MKSLSREQLFTITKLAQFFSAHTNKILWTLFLVYASFFPTLVKLKPYILSGLFSDVWIAEDLMYDFPLMLQRARAL